MQENSWPRAPKFKNQQHTEKVCHIFTNGALLSNSCGQPRGMTMAYIVCVWGGLKDATSYQLHLGLFVNNLWFLGGELSPMEGNSN